MEEGERFEFDIQTITDLFGLMVLEVGKFNIIARPCAVSLHDGKAGGIRGGQEKHQRE